MTGRLGAATCDQDGRIRTGRAHPPSLTAPVYYPLAAIDGLLVLTSCRSEAWLANHTVRHEKDILHLGRRLGARLPQHAMLLLRTPDGGDNSGLSNLLVIASPSIAGPLLDHYVAEQATLHDWW